MKCIERKKDENKAKQRLQEGGMKGIKEGNKDKRKKKGGKKHKKTTPERKRKRQKRE